MRLQLSVAARLAAVMLASVVGAGTARADGTLSMRNVYYKERATRVIQPMLDGMFEVGTRGLVTGHLLVDAITSASASSGAAAAQAFTERRYEAGGGYAHEVDGPDGSWVDLVRLGAQTRFSREPDYRSLYVGVRGEAEVAQKNATLGLGGGVSADNLDASGSQDSSGISEGIKLMCPGDPIAQSDSCDLRTYSLFAWFSHLTSRNSVVALTYDLAHQQGFLANPYRQVIVAPVPIAERHPEERTRHAVAVSARLFVPRLSTAFIAAYRYYWDSWNINAHTPELRVIQQIGRNIDAAFRYRYYTQDASFFWERRYTTPMRPYLTDDPKMSPFTGHILETKLGVLGDTFGLDGRWAGARFEGILEYVIQNNRYGNAVVAHAALTIPFEY
jgi:hypothetical protein